MKTRSFSPISLAPSFIFCCLLAVQIFATQISFVPSPPPRNPNQQNQQGQQPQKGLSPEKKKALSKFGPEDAFPGAREQEEKNKTPNRQPTRRPTPAPKPSITSSPSPSPSATMAPAPAATKAVLTPASPTPAATQLASALAMQQSNPAQPAASASSPSLLVPISLSVAALLVLIALIYVVGMLRKKLREGR